MAKKSRVKGQRNEHAIVNLLKDAGIQAERVPLSGAAGGHSPATSWSMASASRQKSGQAASSRFTSGLPTTAACSSAATDESF